MNLPLEKCCHFLDLALHQKPQFDQKKSPWRMITLQGHSDMSQPRRRKSPVFGAHAVNNGNDDVFGFQTHQFWANVTDMHAVTQSASTAAPGRRRTTVPALSRPSHFPTPQQMPAQMRPHGSGPGCSCQEQHRRWWLEKMDFICEQSHGSAVKAAFRNPDSWFRFEQTS